MAGKRAPIKEMPSQEMLLKLFDYNPETGSLFWRPRLGKGYNVCGKPAGTINARGYLVVGIRTDQKLIYYYAPRIIWKMMTGTDPGNFIDHKNGNRLDNRWGNLRLANNGENICNSKLRKDNRSGVKGVTWDSEAKKWRAVISINKRSIRLGRFASLEQAAKVITAKRAELHGAFARSF
jgi:hypothetical protein